MLFALFEVLFELPTLHAQAPHECTLSRCLSLDGVKRFSPLVVSVVARWGF